MAWRGLKETLDVLKETLDVLKETLDVLKETLDVLKDKNHINISNEYISKYSDKYNKKIIIVHGQHDMDIDNIEYFKKELELVKNNRIIDFKVINNKEHKWFLSMYDENKEYLSIIAILNETKL